MLCVIFQNGIEAYFRDARHRFDGRFLFVTYGDIEIKYLIFQVREITNALLFEPKFTNGFTYTLYDPILNEVIERDNPI